MFLFVIEQTYRYGSIVRIVAGQHVGFRATSSESHQTNLRFQISFLTVAFAIREQYKTKVGFFLRLIEQKAAKAFVFPQ